MFGSTAVGALAGEGRGLAPAVWGATIGLVIGFVSASGLHSLERISTRKREEKMIVPFALVMLIALAAPFASGALTIYVSQRVADAFYDRTAIEPLQITSDTPTSDLNRSAI